MKFRVASKEKVMFILHLPPPVHGSSIMGQYIKTSKAINETFNCKYINLGTSRTIKSIGKKSIRKYFQYAVIITEVLRALVFFKPKTCYLAISAKGTAFYKDAVIAFIIKLFRVKLVLHYHNKGVKENSNKYINNLLYRNLFRNVKVILLSKHLYWDVEKYISESSVYYCPNGIDDSVYNYHVKSRLDNKDVVEILFLSNLIKTKGVFVLLEACNELVKRNVNFHCSLAGAEGDISSEYLDERIRELKLDDVVSYVGYKTDTEKNTIFNEADIFIHPTYDDCFPLVLIEAMQYNLPIISTYEGGIPDIVVDGVTGYLVPKQNVDELVEKMAVLITNNKLRSDMGSAARERYEKYFRIDAFEERLKIALNKVSSGNE